MIGKIAVFCKNLLDWFKSDRCFVKHFIEAFALANNILLLTLLIFGIFIISMYMVIAAQIGVNTWLSLFIIILLSSVLASGFFYSLKKNIENRNEEKSFNIKNSLAIFYTGVGEYWLSFIGMFILFFILATAIILCTVIFADKFLCPIEKLGLNEMDFFTMMAYPSQTDSIIQNLDNAQKIGIRAWTRAFMISTQTFTFLIMLWIPEFIYTKRNQFISLFRSVKKVFKNFFNALCVYLTIMFLNYLLALFILIFGQFNLIVFILNICSLYLLIYNFNAIFLFYNSLEE